MEQRLDTYSRFPSGMQEYLSAYGWHFSKKMCDWAVGKMKTKGGALEPLSREDLDAYVDLIEQKINELIDQRVRILTVNSDIENTKRLCYVGCNYHQSGVTAGGMLRLIRPQGVRAGIVTGSVRMLGHNHRMKGFSDVLKTMLDSKVVDICESLDETEIAYQVTREMLLAHPEINTLYFAAAGAVGGMQAAIDLGLKELTAISCDDTEEIRKLVACGLIQATICQEPFRQGYRAMQILFDSIVNNTPPAEEFCYMDNIIRIRENL